jgi:hypothetical protein
MSRLALLLAPLLLASGCIRISPAGTPHPPWWIGAPAAVLSPTSLEGASWRERYNVLPGRPYISNPPPGPTLQPPPEPLTSGPPPAWDPSHPLTHGP